MFLSLARVGLVAATLAWAGTALLVRFAVGGFRRNRAGLAEIGKRLAWTFETLGGGYLKIGQILSTRRDILPDELVEPLQRLQDSLSSFSAEEARSVIEHSLGLPVETLFRSFDPSPIGSASIAQVHRAVLRSSGIEVAVKIRRRGIDRTVRIDARMFRMFVRLVSLLPRFRGIPLIEGVRQVTDSLMDQASLRTEAEQHRRFFALFEHGSPIRVPRLIDEFCTDEVLVMEYFPDIVKINSLELDDQSHRNAVMVGLRGLYKMLFVAGLVHCDLHPGNILVHPDGTVVILDFGFSTVMRQSERTAFAEFFLAIAFNDGNGAARIVLETALYIPADLERTTFEQEIGELVSQSSGISAGDFFVASFVSSLFSIQRRHRVYGSPSFTMAILSLIVYEGIIRHRYADLDFQREAVPFLLVALEDAM